MSVEASCWAWRQPLPSTRKIILLALADHADKDGICWPSIDTLESKTGLSRATVYRAIRELRADELLDEDGSRWRLTVRQEISQGDEDSQSETPYIDEPSIEPSKESPGASSPSSSGSSSASEVRDVFRYWAEKYAPTSKVIGAKRTRVIKARLKEGLTVAQLKQAIDGAAHDPWLAGEKRESPGYLNKITTLLRDAEQVERLAKLAADHREPAQEETVNEMAIRQLRDSGRDAEADEMEAEQA